MPSKIREGMSEGRPISKDRGAEHGLPDPIPAPIVVEADPIPPLPEDAPDTKFRPGDERTRAIAVAGGKARAEQRRMLKALTRLGVSDSAEYAEFDSMKPYIERAYEFVEHEMMRLAEEVGAGWCPPSAVAMLQTAGRFLAREMWCFDRGHFSDSVNLGEKKNKALREAYEYTAKSAQARKEQKPAGGLNALAQRIKETKK